MDKEKFPQDMGVWRCVECNDKIYENPVYIDGQMYCSECVNEMEEDVIS